MGLFEELRDISPKEARDGMTLFKDKLMSPDGANGKVRAQEAPGLGYITREAKTVLAIEMGLNSEEDQMIIGATLALVIGGLTEVANSRRIAANPRFDD